MAEIFAVFVRLGKFLVVISLAATLGAHWALLQTVAWTTMLADNLRTHSLSESVERQISMPDLQSHRRRQKVGKAKCVRLATAEAGVSPRRGKLRLVRAFELPTFAAGKHFC
jgi:hypothetical protein